MENLTYDEMGLVREALNASAASYRKVDMTEAADRRERLLRRVERMMIERMPDAVLPVLYER